MTHGNNVNGKHDEWEFIRLNIVWVGTVLDRIFWIRLIWVEIFQMGISLGENFLGGNCLSGGYPGWELFGWELSWVRIVQVGVIVGGNFLGGSYPRWEFSLMGDFRLGIVWWESSRWQFSGWEFSCYHNINTNLSGIKEKFKVFYVFCKGACIYV